MTRCALWWLVVVMVLAAGVGSGQEKKKRMTMGEKLDFILQNTQPLKFERGDRLPLFFWHTSGSANDEDEQEIEKALKALNERGLPMVPSWRNVPQPDQRAKTMARCVRIAKVQNRLGLPAYAFAGNTGDGFYAKESTWHVDQDGNHFPDTTHEKNMKLGCPFVTEGWPAVAEQVQEWAKYYKDNGAQLAGVWYDWEFQGPSEWNGAWEMCKKCVRCRKELGEEGLKDFSAFQKRIREIRSAMQKVFVDAIHEHFPKATVANYGCYPMGEYRYWWDYYEKMVEGAPAKQDQRAVFRKWYSDEFRLSGLSIGMPVVYGWGHIYGDFDYTDTDYRWFYNMLLVASDCLQHRPEGTPIVSWVNRFVKLESTPKDAVPLSEEKYRELIWHIFLRGADSVYIWCGEDDILREIVPVHTVYSAALEYKEFLSKGKAILFDVPSKEGPVLSAIRLENKLLVRRTDFGKPPSTADALIEVDGKKIPVPASASGKTVVMDIPQ